MVWMNRIFVTGLAIVFLTSQTLTGTVSAGTPKAGYNTVNITKTLPQTNRIDVEWNLLNLDNTFLNKFRVDYVDGGGNSVSCFVDASDDTNQQTYTTKDLSDCPSTLFPCSIYTITVQPIGLANEDIGVSDEEKDYTLPKNIPNTQLTCTSLKDANDVLSIQVTVDNPKLCLDYYSVSWTGDILWDTADTISPGNGVTTNSFYVIDNVVPYSKYTITVSYDPNSTADDVTCDATTPITDATTNEVQITNTLPKTNRIDVEWKVLKLDEKYLTKFRIDYVEGVKSVSCFVDASDDPQQIYTTEGISNCSSSLSPCTKHTITVQPIGHVDDDIGVKKETQKYTLPQSTPDTQLTCTSLKDVNDVLSIQVTVDKPKNCIDYYSVSWTGDILWATDDTIPPDNGNTTGGSYVIKDVVPYSKYTITVSYDPNSTADDVTCDATTDELAPSAPNDVTVETVDECSLMVTWNEPTKMNGVVEYYTVTYITDDDNGTENANGTELILENLTPCSLYNISVTATNGGSGVGGGGTSGVESHEGTTVPKLNATFSVDDQVINIEWEYLSSTCPITSYELRWSEEVLWSDEMNEYNEKLSEDVTSYELDDTTPYSEYIVYIAAVVDDLKGDDTISDPLETVEKAPSKPRNLNCSSSNETSLKIEWDEPDQLNGKPKYYTISWNKKDQSPSEDKVIATNGNEHFTYIIAELESGTEYYVAVKLKTVEYGNQIDDYYSTLNGKGKGTNLIAIVAGVVVFLIIALIVAVLFIKREDIKKRFSKYKTENEEDEKNPNETRGLARNTESKIQKYFSDMIMKTKSSIQEMSNPTSLEEMFNELNAAIAYRPKTASTNGINKSKNRSKDILPFDHSRVVLANKNLSSDYINASQIKQKKEATVIASQGPTKNTLKEFWTMIFEQDVSLIVMLTRCFENKKDKCHKYWPDRKDSPFQVDIFDIQLMEKKESDKCTIRKLYLTNKKLDSAKTVTQFHYSHWPENEVPAREEDLLMLVQKARDFAVEENFPKVVVHGSSGVGRTGTFIALWHLQHDAEKRKPDVNVRKTVLKIREDRENLVKSKEQYLYIHKCFLKFLENRSQWSVAKDGRVPSSDQLQGVSNYSSGNRPAPVASRPQRNSSPIPPHGEARTRNHQRIQKSASHMPHPDEGRGYNPPRGQGGVRPLSNPDDARTHNSHGIQRSVSHMPYSDDARNRNFQSPMYPPDDDRSRNFQSPRPHPGDARNHNFQSPMYPPDDDRSRNFQSPRPHPGDARNHNFQSSRSPPGDARSRDFQGSRNPMPPTRDYRDANQPRMNPPRTPYQQGGNVNNPPPPRRPYYE